VALCVGHLGEVRLALARLDGASPPPPRGAVPAVVYYIGDPGRSLVKIGTTTRLRARFAAVAAAHRRCVLLATEPGTYPLEMRRHRQFKTLRYNGEWFRKAPVLMEHVGRLRIQYGILPTSDGLLPARSIAPLRTGPDSPGGDPQP
jgi:hypothetical protein